MDGLGLLSSRKEDTESGMGSENPRVGTTKWSNILAKIMIFSGDASSLFFELLSNVFLIILNIYCF